MKNSRLHLWSRLVALLALGALLALFVQLYYTEFRLPLALTASLVLGIILLIGSLAVGVLRANRQQPRPKARVLTLFLLMINLPLAAFYLYFLHLQLNSVQLTLKNNTQEVISELQLISCSGEGLSIDELAVGEGQSLWLPISDTCPLSLKFKHNSNIYIKTVHTNFHPGLIGNKLVYYIQPDGWPLDKSRPERKKKKKKE